MPNKYVQFFLKRCALHYIPEAKFHKKCALICAQIILKSAHLGLNQGLPDYERKDQTI
jgi:hypothetical protein